MDDERLLLSAVLAAPEDDTPRLVYADWLEERAGGDVECRRCRGSGMIGGFCGDNVSTPVDYFEDPCPACRGAGRVPDGRAARAEFIRVQCELARITRELRDADSPSDLSDECGIEGCPCLERTALRRRERELFVTHGCDWFLAEPLTAITTDSGAILGHTHPYRRPAVVGTVRCGFVTAVALTVQAFNAVAADLFATQPVTTVTLPGVVRGGIVFRTSNGHEGDIPADLWAELDLPRCEPSVHRFPRDADCHSRGTHAHMPEAGLSAYLVRLGRKRAVEAKKVPDLWGVTNR